VKEHLVNYISYINNILVKVKLMELIELQVESMWELGAGEVAPVGVWLRCAPLTSGLLGVGAGPAHTPNKAPGPYA
jgi:hypothetical protein